MLDRLREREHRFLVPERAAKQAVEVDPDARARLAALGYVGTFVATAAPDEARTGLADPKDKVDLFNKITEARDISKDDAAFDEVVTMLNEVVQEDPKVIDAWFMLGNMYAKAGRHREAIPYFKAALALKPDDEMAVVNLANAYRQIGRDDDALVGFRRFLELDQRIRRCDMPRPKSSWIVATWMAPKKTCGRRSRSSRRWRPRATRSASWP